MKKDAIRNIDHQRRIGGSRDIVDMVMDLARQTHPETFGRQARKKTSSRMRLVESLKHTLHRLQTQEAASHGDLDFVRGPIVKLRQTVERELVNAAVPLAVNGGAMTGREAEKWRSLYTKKSQQAREVNGEQFDLLHALSRYL